MYSDIVFPESNEQEFIKIAEALGYSKLYFIYPFSKLKDIKQIESKQVKIETGIITDIKGLSKANKQSQFVLFRGSNRSVFEKASASIIFDLETEQHQDFMHQRNSGLNHVLAKLAHDSSIAVGFSFSSLLKAKSPELKARLIGRISQNIRLCRKYKVNTRIASFASSPYQMRSPHDLIALFSLLGMHPAEAKDALN